MQQLKQGNCVSWRTNLFLNQFSKQGTKIKEGASLISWGGDFLAGKSLSIFSIPEQKFLANRKMSVSMEIKT